jgi:DNA-binding Xre family transcriptional regulator
MKAKLTPTKPKASKALPPRSVALSSAREAPRALVSTPPVTRPSLGERVRQIRRENNWTLQDLSRKTGVGPSTLSKLENNQVDVTFDTVMKICDGLDLSLLHLTNPRQSPLGGGGVRTVTRRDEGLPLTTPTYGLEVLCTEIAKKSMVPVIVTVKARHLAEFPQMNQHDGEEFIYVLRGTMRLHTEIYGPTELREGDSAYYDSSMPHAFINAGPGDAVVLSISHDSSGGSRNATGHLVPEDDNK